MLTKALSLARSLFSRRPTPAAPQATLPTPRGDTRDYARKTVEKIRTAYLAGRFHLLPWLDVLTDETPEIRAHYRVMLREPILQSALRGQVLSVASQEVQVHSDESEDPEDPRQDQLRKAVKYALSKIHGGNPLLPLGRGPHHIAWSILSGAIVDGWSLCEQTYKRTPERKGPCVGKLLWETLKAKDTTHVQLVTDRFWNIEGVRAPRFNPGQVFTGEDLQSFVVFNQLSFFEQPIGLSSFRAAYRAFVIKDTARKFWALHLEKYSTPGLRGTYATIDQKAALEEAFEDWRASGYITIPAGTLVEALDIAGRGTSEYNDAIKSCDEEMLTAVCGAYLHMMTSQVPNARGDSEVQKETTELFQWALSACLGDVVSAQMVAPWCRLNYHDVEPPTVTWGAVSEGAMEARARVDKALQEIGLELSKKEAYTYYGRQRPTDPEDVLSPDGAGPGMGGPPGVPGAPPPSSGGGGGGGGGQEWSPFGEALPCECGESPCSCPSTFAERRDSRGYRRCYDDNTGRQIKCTPLEKEKKERKPAAKKEPAKVNPTVDEVHQALVKAKAEPDKLTAEHISTFAGMLGSLKVDEIKDINKRLSGVKGSGAKSKLVEDVLKRAGIATREGKPGAVPVPTPATPAVPARREPEKQATPTSGASGWDWEDWSAYKPPVQGGTDEGRGSDTAGGGQTDQPSAEDRGRVEEEADRPEPATADQERDTETESARAATAGRVPASVPEVNRRIDRFERFFRGKGQGHVADWLGKLREHVNAVGADAALAALGEDLGEGEEGQVQYEGASRTPIWESFGGFTEAYLKRNGITPVLQGEATPSASGRLVSSMSRAQGGVDERPADLQYLAGDFSPTDPTFKDKLEEAKHLPGLEKSEDLGVLMGEKVTHLTPETLKKLDERYGPGQWIVKAYGDEAAAGYGIFFPQRAAQIMQDARSTIWTAGEHLGKYGFRLGREPDTGKVFGLVHESGDTYQFGTPEYESTIGGDARHWAEQAKAAADSERGAMLPGGGKDFMAQPAFKAVGVSDADRAAGRTIAPGEGRVHITTRDGKVEVVPSSTWIKGESLPVVFESEDTRAMAEAARKAIEALPESERKGQIYAPDIIKSEDGYRVVEANPANETGSSGYLGDNPFIIDAYASHLTGRSPAHVRFIRSLLSSKRGKPSAMGEWEEGKHPRAHGKFSRVPGGSKADHEIDPVTFGNRHGIKDPAEAWKRHEGVVKQAHAEGKEIPPAVRRAHMLDTAPAPAPKQPTQLPQPAGYDPGGPDRPTRTPPSDPKDCLLLQAAYDRLPGARHGLVSLVDLTSASGLPLPRVHAAVQDLRRLGVFTLSAAEGRGGITEAERAHSIYDPGSRTPLLHVSKRDRR